MNAWQRFWFTPQPTSTLALFRIGYGLVAIAWTASLAPNVMAFLGPGGIYPDRPTAPGVWGLLALSRSGPVVLAVFAATFAAAVALTLGWRSRVAAVVLFVGIVSLQRGNPLVLNAGDGLIRSLALFCALAPCGAALSLDRRRTDPDRFWEFPARAPWALRLIQVQLSVMYLSTVWRKLQGARWRDGSAVSYALRLEDIHRFPVPGFLTDSVVLMELLTFGTLALELAIGVLVWQRTVRPWVLGLGVTLHLGIEYSLVVGFFSWAVLVMYLAFVPPEVGSRVILAFRPRDYARRSA